LSQLLFFVGELAVAMVYTPLLLGCVAQLLEVDNAFLQ
jgi:hypothetical protein